MTDLQTELEHLAKNSRPHPNCALYCREKAAWLAQKYPERFRDLPQLLAAEMKSSGSVASGTPADSSSTVAS